MAFDITLTRNLSKEQIIQKFRDEKIVITTALDQNTGLPLLHAAARHGLINTLIALLELGYDINQQERTQSYTALHIACKHGKQDVVSYLLYAGIRTTTRSKNGSTALHIAALHANARIVDLLIASNSSLLRETNSDNEMPIHTLLEYPHTFETETAAVYILSKYQPLPDGLLIRALKNNYRRVIEELVRRKFDFTLLDQNGNNFLHLLAKMNKYIPDDALLTKLIEQISPELRKAFINQKTKDNDTPMHIAERSQNTALIRFLLKLGAKIDITPATLVIPAKSQAKAFYQKTVGFIKNNWVSIVVGLTLLLVTYAVGCVFFPPLALSMPFMAKATSIVIAAGVSATSPAVLPITALYIASTLSLFSLLAITIIKVVQALKKFFSNRLPVANAALVANSSNPIPAPANHQRADRNCGFSPFRLLGGLKAIVCVYPQFNLPWHSFAASAPKPNTLP